MWEWSLLHVNIFNPEHANIKTVGKTVWSRHHHFQFSKIHNEIKAFCVKIKLRRENTILASNTKIYRILPYTLWFTLTGPFLSELNSWEDELEIGVWRSEDLKPGYWVFSIYSIHSINISYYCNAQFYSTVTNSDFCDFSKRWAQRELLPSKNSAEVKNF